MSKRNKNKSPVPNAIETETKAAETDTHRALVGNEPEELGLALDETRATLAQYVVSKDTVNRGFAYTVGHVWHLFQLGHFEHKELVQMVPKLHADKAAPKHTKSNAITYLFNRLGLVKAIPALTMPEPLSKKHASDAEYKEYEAAKKAYRQTHNPLVSLLSRVVVLVAYLSHDSRKGMVRVIQIGKYTGCLSVAGPLYSGNDKDLDNRNLVPYDKACAEMEKKAKNAFSLLKSNNAGSSATFNAGIFNGMLGDATKHVAIEGQNISSATMIAMCNILNAALEKHETPFDKMVPDLKRAVHGLIYTVVNNQIGMVTADNAKSVLADLDGYKIEDDTTSKAKNIKDAIAETPRVPMKSEDATT